MKDFLEFLNTASEDELKTFLEIKPALALEIVSARPFASLEDVNRVKGLSAKKLAALKEKYEQPLPESQKEEPTPLDNTLPETKPNSMVGRTILRILIALLILGALFAALYFGIPWFKEKVLNPLQTNTARVSEVASQQVADMQRLSDEIATLQASVATLETRADAVDQSLKTHTETLAILEKMQTMLQSNLDAHKADISAQINEQLTLTRAIELLARSRLYLSQSNFGLAQTDVASARALLYSLLPGISADQLNGLKVVISRLDLALNNLPTYPVVAVYDIDIAWQLLVDGLPNVPQGAVTPVISETLPVTPTPLPTEATPTP